MIRIQKAAAFLIFSLIFWLAMSLSAGTWKCWEWSAPRITLTGLCVIGSGIAIMKSDPHSRKYKNKYK